MEGKGEEDVGFEGGGGLEEREREDIKERGRF